MRTLVLFPSALGDLCLAAPSMAALVAAGARVELSIRRAVAPIAALLLPDVPLGPPIDGAAMATLFGGDLSADVRAWLHGADRVHAWLGQGAALGEVATRLAAMGLDVALHAVPRADGARHVSMEYASVFGLASAPAPIVARPPDASGSWAWGVAAVRRLVMHPGAGAVAKQWSREGFRAVADDWVAAGGEVVVLLGPAEEEATTWWEATRVPVVADLSLGAAAALVASAPWWLGNDSGMSHVAGALGRRGVVLFGPTRAERWMPLGSALRPVRFSDRPEAVVARDVLAILGAGEDATQLDTPRPRH